MVRPDYCAVDHLQAGVAAAAVVEGFEQQLPQAGQRPATELAVNRRPFAEMLVKVAPCNARSRNPENPIQNKAMVPRTTPAPRTALDHERLKTSPFLVAHQSPDHSSLPKSHLESDTAAFGNPLCQHFLEISGGFDYELGGPSRNRTGVRGFAVRYVTTPPSGLVPRLSAGGRD